MVEYATTSIELKEDTREDGIYPRMTPKSDEFLAPNPPDPFKGWRLVGSAANADTLFWFWAIGE